VDPEMKAEMEEMQKKGPIAGAGGAADSSKYSPSTRDIAENANSKQYKTLTSLGGWLEGRIKRSDVLISAKLLYHLLRTATSDTLYCVWVQGCLTSC
jgi:hypothetical protein